MPSLLRASLLLALAGCAVGPDYQQPEIDTPDAWHQALTDGLVSGESSFETWWTVVCCPGKTWTPIRTVTR